MYHHPMRDQSMSVAPFTSMDIEGQDFSNIEEVDPEEYANQSSYSNIPTSSNYSQQVVFIGDYKTASMEQNFNPQIQVRRRRWTQRDMTKAYNAVKYCGMSLRSAASTFSVPESTLRDRVHGRVSLDCNRPGPPTFFTHDEEKKMVDHILFMSKIGYPYTRNQVVELAGDMTKAVGRIAPFKYLNPSQAWFYAFLNRWPDLKNFLYGPRTNRKSKGVSGDAMQAYFEQLDKILTKYGIKDKPNHIWTVDELSISCENQPPRILPIGIQRAQSISYWSPTVAMLGAGSAAGERIPPFLIYRGDNISHMMMEGAVRGTKFATSQTGWVNSDAFIQWFTKHLKVAVTQRPLVLLYDGHLQFVSVRVLERAKDEGVLLFPLPPHPAYNHCIENTCYWAFQRYFKKRVERFFDDNIERPLTKMNVCPVLCHAHERALQPGNLVHLFRKAGICPFNNYAISVGAYSKNDGHPYDERLSTINSRENLVGPMHQQLRVAQQLQPRSNITQPSLSTPITNWPASMTENIRRQQSVLRPLPSVVRSNSSLPMNIRVVASTKQAASAAGPANNGSLRLQGPGAIRSANSGDERLPHGTKRKILHTNANEIMLSNPEILESSVDDIGDDLQTMLRKQLKAELTDDLEFDLVHLTGDSSTPAGSEFDHLIGVTGDWPGGTATGGAEEEPTLATEASVQQEEDEECDVQETCGVCGQLEPPEGKGGPLEDLNGGGGDMLQVVDWAHCDYCDKWVHLTVCCDERCVLPDNSFMCVVCRRNWPDPSSLVEDLTEDKV